MKTEIYQWVRILTAFYILFAAVLQLMPDKKYERYIRSFMGLLLVYILCMPIFSVIKSSRGIMEDFAGNYHKENQVLEQKETQNLQGFYIRKGFQKELEAQITKKCEEAGIKIQKVIVDIEGEKISVLLTVKQSLSEQQERGVRDELRQGFGLEEQNIKILTGEDEKTAVDRNFSDGASSVSDRTSGIQKEQYSTAENAD